MIRMLLALLAFLAPLAVVASATPASAQYDGHSGGVGNRASSTSAVRLALQGRLTAVQYSETTGIGVGPRDVGIAHATLAPYATAGVRLLESRLFVGLGIGFGSYTYTECMATCASFRSVSRGYVGVSPVVSFDVLKSGPAALYGLGWFTFGSVGGSTIVFANPAMRTSTDLPDGGSALGASLALGVRAHIVDGLAIGTEWGWGFSRFVFDGREDGEAEDESIFTHGLFGTVLVEGSIGI